MDFNKGIVKAITMYHTATRGEYANYNNISGVYIIKNTITNKIYIGSSNNLGNRISKHFSECKHNRHPNRLFQLDFDKHSQSSFVFNIELITNNYKDEEYKLQLKYDKDILYNNSIGGKLSTQHKNAVGIANTKWVRDDEYRYESTRIYSNTSSSSSSLSSNRSFSITVRLHFKARSLYDLAFTLFPKLLKLIARK